MVTGKAEAYFFKYILKCRLLEKLNNLIFYRSAVLGSHSESH